MFRRLEELAWGKLTPETRLDVVRALQVVAVRLGDPEGALLEKLHGAMPSLESRWNVEASQLLVRWKSPRAAREILPLFEKAPTQEEQMSFAARLRLVSEVWPEGAREKFFRWFLREEFHKAGHPATFITDTRKDAVDSLTDAEKVALEKVLSAPPESGPAPPVASRLFVKDWGTDELIA